MIRKVALVIGVLIAGIAVAWLSIPTHASVDGCGCRFERQLRVKGMLTIERASSTELAGQLELSSRAPGNGWGQARISSPFTATRETVP